MHITVDGARSIQQLRLGRKVPFPASSTVHTGKKALKTTTRRG